MIHRDGTGPLGSTTLFTVPQIPAGPCLLGIRGEAVGTGGSGGVVTFTAGGDVMYLNGNDGLKKFTIYSFVTPGDVVTYAVTQYGGQSIAYDFDFFFCPVADLAFE